MGIAGVDVIASWGIRGQFIYINSESGIVISKHSSDPEAVGDNTDTDTPMVMHAIAKHLAKKVANRVGSQ